MKKLYYLTLALGMTMAFSAKAAVTVNVETPGTLEQTLFDQTVEEYAAIETLTVTGSLNSADLDALTTMSKDYKLVSLDLSNANIENNVFPDVTDGIFNHSKLTNLVVPKTLTSLGAGSFPGTLVTISIPTTNLKEIPEHKFTWCSQLKEIEIPEGVTTIGKECFVFCTALKKVTLPTTLTTLTESAFLGNVGFTAGFILPITDFYVKMTTVPTVGSAAICLGGYWDLCTLHVPVGTVAAYRANVIDSWYGFGMITNIEEYNYNGNAINQLSASNLKVYTSADKTITIEGAANKEPVAVYSLAGTIVRSFKASTDKVTVNVPNAGMYLVKVGAQTVKVAL
ncbi:MAG: leucine-rich repeat domain-containing protein [Bacteroidota bacterium]|nr:leucine-rich repeat domain-containing protein [Bacteroidota bacterium]